MTNSVTGRACAQPSCVHDAPVDEHGRRDRAPAEDGHARRTGHRDLRLPLLDRRHRSLGRHRQPRVARDRRRPAGTRLDDGEARRHVRDPRDAALALHRRRRPRHVGRRPLRRRVGRGRQRHRLRHRRPGHARQPRAAALRAAAQDRRQAPALLGAHPGRRRARARRDQARHARRSRPATPRRAALLQDHPQAQRARQPARRSPRCRAPTRRSRTRHRSAASRRAQTAPHPCGHTGPSLCGRPRCAVRAVALQERRW